MADRPVDPSPKEKIIEDSTPKGKKGKKGLILLGGIFFIILAGMGAVYFLKPGLLPGTHKPEEVKDPSKEVKEVHSKTQGHIYSMDPIVVNLADMDIPRYLKIRIEIESQESKANEEFDKRLPQLKDTIITILSSKTYQEIFDSDGKIKLKETMIEKTNRLLKSFKVKTIYFTEFVVQ
jgi:flagellar FliL protein